MHSSLQSHMPFSPSHYILKTKKNQILSLSFLDTSSTSNKLATISLFALSDIHLPNLGPIWLMMNQLLMWHSCSWLGPINTPFFWCGLVLKAKLWKLASDHNLIFHDSYGLSFDDRVWKTLLIMIFSSILHYYSSLIIPVSTWNGPPTVHAKRSCNRTVY